MLEDESCFTDISYQFKCDELVGNSQADEYRLITWVFGYKFSFFEYSSLTLEEKLIRDFPGLKKPFEVLLIGKFNNKMCSVRQHKEVTNTVILDRDGDKGVLPIDDVKETVSALQELASSTQEIMKIFIRRNEKYVSTTRDGNGMLQTTVSY